MGSLLRFAIRDICRACAARARHHERRAAGGGDGAGDGVAALVEVDLAVPLAPDLGRGEHAPFATHVTEGALARGLRAAALHTRDTRDRATSAPRDGRVLHTRSLAHGVRLASVLGHVRVHEIHHVRADRRREHARQRHRLQDSALRREHRHHGARISPAVSHKNIRRRETERSRATHTHTVDTRFMRVLATRTGWFGPIRSLARVEALRERLSHGPEPTQSPAFRRPRAAKNQTHESWKGRCVFRCHERRAPGVCD